MKSTVTHPFLFFFLLLFTANNFAVAQVVIPAPASSDTIRLIQIIQGKSLRKKIVDTTSFQTIAGSVQLKEALTLFNCDSASINERTNVMEAFGSIHINQQDSIHTYSQYLKYIGQERIAYLKKDVRLTDKKGTLYTQELEYDLKTNIGKYKNGGKVVNGKTILTSDEGVYYADTKDVYFKKNVHLVDPQNDIRADSLLYNTQLQRATFITLTVIKNKNGGEIYTTSGTYDLKTGKAFFANRTIFKDSTRTYVADNVAIDDSTGIAQLEGNAVIRDSTNGYSIIGGQIFTNKKTQTFLATRKPVLIFVGEGKDSTFIAGDTLFSGIEKRNINREKILLQTDTLNKTLIVQEGKNDSTAIVNTDSTQRKIVVVDSMGNAMNNEKKIADTTIKKIDSTVTKTKVILPADTTAAATTDDMISIFKNKNDTTGDVLKKDTTINISSDTAIRYFQAFHHVRIFNDSIQAVCDSLLYSSADSIFRLYKDPLVFSNKSQIAGDTIHLFIKNKKPERVYVFDNGIMINEVNKQMYNQMGGRTLNGYFKDGVLDYMRVKGSPAESVFYPQDEDSAFTGMNRCKGDVIDIYFIDKAVNKVKFINDVDGTMYPMNQIPEDQKQLAKFKWLDARRPKNKLELFE